MKRLAAAILCVGVTYGIYPYWSAYALLSGVRNADYDVLEAYVDWNELRTNLKNEAAASMLFANSGKNRISTDLVLSSMATALNNATRSLPLNAAIDTLVSPQAIASILAKSKPPGDRPSTADTIGLVRSASFTTPTSFRVDLGKPETSSDQWASLRFALKDWGWKLTSIRLPTYEAPRESRQATQESRDLMDRKKAFDRLIQPTAKDGGAPDRSGYDNKERQSLDRLIEGKQ